MSIFRVLLDRIASRRRNAGLARSLFRKNGADEADIAAEVERPAPEIEALKKSLTASCAEPASSVVIDSISQFVAPREPSRRPGPKRKAKVRKRRKHKRH